MADETDEAYRQRVEDMQAALRALWPGRATVYFTKDAALAAEKGPGDQLTDDEQRQLGRVAHAIRTAREDAEADAADAWRNFHEAQRDIDSLQRRLETPKPVSTGDAALDRRVDEAAFEAGLQSLYEEARTTVARAIGLARDIGYRQATVERPDEALDPEAVRAVELEDAHGQRGTLIGPADKIGALVRPEAVVVTVPLQALEELAKESTLVAAAFDDVVAPRSGYEGQQAKIATLIGDLGVEGL